MLAGAAPVRSFIAIELGDPVRSAVREYLDGLRTALSGVAWTRPGNLHLTLKFLGAAEPSRLEAVAERMLVIARVQAPFTMTVAGVGAFPSVLHPRVLWVRVSAAALAGLAVEVDRACVAEGFPPETRSFHSHVTLGRVRQPTRHAGSRKRGRSSEHGDVGAIAARLASDGSREFGNCQAEAIVLFRSDLHPEGARYTPLRVVTFTGQSPVGGDG